MSISAPTSSAPSSSSASLSPKDLEDLLALATTAARQAAEILCGGFRKHPKVFHKGRVDLVTEFDRESERFLREALAPTGISFVGEELGGERATGDRPTWYVDPLDGTTNFAHGHPFFCVSIGLVQNGVARLGVVDAPALGVVWRGTDGRAPERNGVTCGVSETLSLGDSLLATGFPYDRQTSSDNNFDAFVAIKKKAQAVRRCGSAAMDLCLVADGTYDGYWERKLKPWDIAAGMALVTGAGGRTSTFHDHPCDPAVGHVVATNGRIHGELLAALAAT